MVEQKAKLLGRIYDHVELALWASLLAGVAVFAVFVVPGLPAAQQRNEAERVAAFEHECEFYCTKWGLGEARTATRPASPICTNSAPRSPSSLPPTISEDRVGWRK